MATSPGPQRRALYRGQLWPQPDRPCLPHRRAGAEQGAAASLCAPAALAAEVDVSGAQARVGVRCASQDHLPVAGPVARLAALADRDVNAPAGSAEHCPCTPASTCWGARLPGVCSAPLCGELVASGSAAIPCRWPPICWRRSTPPATGCEGCAGASHCATNPQEPGCPPPRYWTHQQKTGLTSPFLCFP